MADLSKNEFSTLQALYLQPGASQRALTGITGLSLGSVNNVVKTLVHEGLVEDGRVTEAGLEALEPFKVDNAVILAAGLSSRFAPISYEKPKGLLRVRGDVLIERQIRQLQEAGIDDITVVVGYKGEYFFYLEEKFGVTIVMNKEFASRNNHSSLMVTRDRLRRTYICSSDNYFVNNPFEPYAWRAYYAAQYVEGPTSEWCIKTGTGGRITGVTVGGADSLIMLGHVFFDEAFSARMREILEAEYDLPATADKLWEDLFIDHIDELYMIARPYKPGELHEFDSLDELRDFDPQFLENVDSEAFDNIVSVLGCKKSDICDVYPLKQGLTNLSCHFRVGDGEYVYRHPGIGTEELIDRAVEAEALGVARDLGLDDTFIYADPKRGWKLSRFVPDCTTLDPTDPAQLRRAMEMARALHETDARVERPFDFYDEGKRYESLLVEREGAIDVPGFYEMAKRIDRLRDLTLTDDSFTCLCHNDFFMLNFLIDPHGEVDLIDWEYAGMSDYAQDFGTFTVCCQLTDEQADEALCYYFGRTPTPQERRHNFAYVAFAGWCWYVWSLLKEAEGDNVGEWLYIYYRYAKRYLDQALSLYEA
ncbi:phosphotransferase [Eggerthellaceae bacterium zg-893]|nr:phosphotransferase [Eggerthellaceae bacterium zg-893]